MNYEEITKENTFWKLFKLTWKLSTAKDTYWVFLISMSLLFLYYTLNLSGLEKVEDLIVSSTNTLLSASVSLLGFIFAAYVVFANMTDKELMYVMAVNDHPEHNMSFLKYGHCNFIKIMFDLLCIIFVTYLGAIIVPTLPKFAAVQSTAIKLIFVFVLAVYQSFFILVLMLCKSAIYNVYHSIMLSIRWYAEDKAKKPNK